MLASKEALGLCAALALASRATEQHLLRACHIALQMILGNVGKGINEDGAAVQAVCPLDGICVAALANHLLIQLVQRFNMI